MLDLGIDWRIILKLILKEFKYGGVDRIYLAETVGQCRAFVKKGMNLRVP